MPHDDLILSRYFSDSYQEGREKLLAACGLAALDVLKVNLKSTTNGYCIFVTETEYRNERNKSGSTEFKTQSTCLHLGLCNKR